jgi:wyosine [tRNA(Phe)-imidazoG37] synthetase (radical SAM superfamily)
MKYVFGPVPSRRLGQSLGIDTIPLKTCNWNCVYCQLGRTVPLTNERREHFPREEILAEVEHALGAHKPGEIDWVTFVGSGEPTLHAGLGWLIQNVKELTVNLAQSRAKAGSVNHLPVAVITNGALLYLPEVRRELALADAVLPSLDAGNANLYLKVNRPHPEVTFERLVDGLIAFHEEFHGRLWIEVMLVEGLNDSEDALHQIMDILERVQPDEVHINLPTRLPAETWVKPPQEEGLLRAMTILGKVARVVHPAEGSFDLSGFESAVDAVVSIITRHPMRQEELERSLARWAPGQVNEALAALESSGRAQIVERYGARFWSAAPGHYPDQNQSLRANPNCRKESCQDHKQEHQAKVSG